MTITFLIVWYQLIMHGVLFHFFSDFLGGNFQVYSGNQDYQVRLWMYILEVVIFVENL